MNYLKTILIATIALFTMTSCDEGKDAELHIGDAELSLDIDAEMSDFEKKMKNFGEKIEEEIAEIDAKLENAGDDISKGLQEERAEWIEARNELSQRMKKFSNSTQDNWAEFKSDIQNFFEDLEGEFES